jgi:hypothetical protein
MLFQLTVIEDMKYYFTRKIRIQMLHTRYLGKKHLSF